MTDWILITIIYGGVGVAAHIWIDSQMNMTREATPEKLKWCWLAGLIWPLWFFVWPVLAIIAMKRNPEWSEDK